MATFQSPRSSPTRSATPDKKYLTVMEQLYLSQRGRDEFAGPVDYVWQAPYTEDFSQPQRAPTDLENWYEYQPVMDGGDNGSYIGAPVYIKRSKVEEAYKQTPQGAAEERDRVVAEERARAKQLIDEMDRQQKEREATWLEQQRQAQEKFTAEQARLDAEMKAQQKAFDDARAAKAKAKEMSQVQSAQTQLTALERMGAAKETLVSHDEQTAANVMEEQKTLLERLLKKGKA